MLVCGHRFVSVSNRVNVRELWDDDSAFYNVFITVVETHKCLTPSWRCRQSSSCSKGTISAHITLYGSNCPLMLVASASMLLQPLGHHKASLMIGQCSSNEFGMLSHITRRILHITRRTPHITCRILQGFLIHLQRGFQGRRFTKIARLSGPFTIFHQIHSYYHTCNTFTNWDICLFSDRYRWDFAVINSTFGICSH